MLRCACSVIFYDILDSYITNKSWALACLVSVWNLNKDTLLSSQRVNIKGETLIFTYVSRKTSKENQWIIYNTTQNPFLFSSILFHRASHILKSKLTGTVPLWSKTRIKLALISYLMQCKWSLLKPENCLQKGDTLVETYLTVTFDHLALFLFFFFNLPDLFLTQSFPFQ